MKKLFSLLLIFLVCATVGNTKQINVLLIGDSTTQGSTPNRVNPKRPQLVGLVASLFNAVSESDSLVVYKSAMGGESAKSIFTTKRYEKGVVAGFKDKDIDIVIVRYGINDWFKCDDIDKEFPADLDVLWTQIKKDFPNAKYIAQTITPFLQEKESIRMNNHIKDVAKKHNIMVNDIYTPYAKAQAENGAANYWVRMASLDQFPKKYHEMLKSYTYTIKTSKGKQSSVQLDDNSLDYLFMNPPKGAKKKGWSWMNHHPNSAGYAIIARETVDFLLENIKNGKLGKF